MAADKFKVGDIVVRSKFPTEGRIIWFIGDEGYFFVNIDVSGIIDNEQIIKYNPTMSLFGRDSFHKNFEKFGEFKDIKKLQEIMVKVSSIHTKAFYESEDVLSVITNKDFKLVKEHE